VPDSTEEPRWIVRRDGTSSDSDAKRIREELRRIKATPDDEIDLSDIPETTPHQWAATQPNRFYRPVKDQVTLDIERYVLHWFMLGNDDYPAEINEVLTEYVTRRRRAEMRRRSDEEDAREAEANSGG
jgi:uncharacterized protein (DUF4415 family)